MVTFPENKEYENFLQIQRFVNDWGFPEANDTLENSPFNLTINYNSEYDCYTYTYNMITSDMSMLECREARGLMLSAKDPKKVVCIGFDKFFNYGEYLTHIALNNIVNSNNLHVIATEKIDGSIIKITAKDRTRMLTLDNMLVSTNNVIDAYTTSIESISPEVRSFGDIFDRAVASMLEAMEKVNIPFELNPDYSYIFELTSKYNRVVTPYTEPHLRFLGCRNLYNGKELGIHERLYAPEKLNHLGKSVDFFYSDADYHPSVVAGSDNPISFINDMKDKSTKWDWKYEGIVISHSDFQGNYSRIKIKGKEYLGVHKIRGETNPTPKRIMVMILNNNIDDFLGYFPEYTGEVAVVQTQFDVLLSVMASVGGDVLHKQSVGASRKEIASFLNTMVSSSYIRAFAFKKLTNATMQPLDYVLDNVELRGYNGLLQALGYRNQ